jgi:hypothetical protein
LFNGKKNSNLFIRRKQMKFKVGDKVRTTKEYRELKLGEYKGIVEGVIIRSGLDDDLIEVSIKTEYGNVVNKQFDASWLELDITISFDIDYHCEKIEEKGFSYIPDTMSEWKDKLIDREYKQLAYVLSLAKWKYMKIKDYDNTRINYCGLCIYQNLKDIIYDLKKCNGCRLNDAGDICCE